MDSLAEDSNGAMPLPSPFSYDPHFEPAAPANPFDRLRPAIGRDAQTGPLFLGFDLSTQVKCRTRHLMYYLSSANVRPTSAGFESFIRRQCTRE